MSDLIKLFNWDPELLRQILNTLKAVEDAADAIADHYKREAVE